MISPKGFTTFAQAIGLLLGQRAEATFRRRPAMRAELVDQATRAMRAQYGDDAAAFWHRTAAGLLVHLGTGVPANDLT